MIPMPFRGSHFKLVHGSQRGKDLSFVLSLIHSLFTYFLFARSFIFLLLPLFCQYSYSIVSKAMSSISSSVYARLRHSLMMHAHGVRKINFALPFSFPLKLLLPALN